MTDAVDKTASEENILAKEFDKFSKDRDLEI